MHCKLSIPKTIGKLKLVFVKLRLLNCKLKLDKIKLPIMKITEKIENKLVDLKLWEALVLFFVLVDLKADAEATQSPPEGFAGISCC